MAYRLEGDGSRVYLCENHIPGAEDPETPRPELRVAPLSQAKMERR